MYSKTSLQWTPFGLFKSVHYTEVKSFFSKKTYSMVSEVSINKITGKITFLLLSVLLFDFENKKINNWKEIKFQLHSAEILEV
jgi:hypothetical protein